MLDALILTLPWAIAGAILIQWKPIREMISEAVVTVAVCVVVVIEWIAKRFE